MFLALIALSSLLFYWAMLLIVVSFGMEDRRIFWVQRILAFVMVFGAVGVAVYASP